MLVFLHLYVHICLHLRPLPLPLPLLLVPLIPLHYCLKYQESLPTVLRDIRLVEDGHATVGQRPQDSAHGLREESLPVFESRSKFLGIQI